MREKWHTLLKTHRSGFRLLKLVKDIDRDLIPLSLLEACLTTSVPYVSLTFTAIIVDLLLDKAYASAIHYVIGMLVSLFIIGMLNTFAAYRTSLSQRILQTNLEIAIRKKGMSLEYDIMNDAEVQKDLRNAEDAAKYRGGLGTLVKVYKELLQYTLSALIASVFIFIFCMTRGSSESSVLSFFTHPAVTIASLLMAWAVGMKLSSTQAKKIKAIEDNIASKHHEVENQFSYWKNEVIMDTESGKTIRIHGMESMILENVDRFMKRSVPLYESMGISEEKRILSEGIESGLFSVAAYVLVMLKVLTHAITTGAFMQYAGALLQFHQASSKIVWSENEVNRLAKNLLPLADYMARENQRHTGTIPIEKREDNAYEIEFHNVGFCYPNSKQFILKNVNAVINTKTKVAVVGPNGAGKTTFIKLLCRLYDPTEGYITLNGIDIKKYDYEEYLSLFSVVFQDFYLFSSSIAENIATAQNYNEAQVQEVLEQSGVWSFVSTLEKGMHTLIENGAEDAIDLSGGQGQKLSIARALYKNAPFVILDEPTAALDPISESEIYEKFDQMVQNKTSIYISHRMSSCRFCEDIIVFEDGSMVERGTHEGLLQEEGLYSKLWQAQAQYYTQASPLIS